jgi:hypothetical protein
MSKVVPRAAGVVFFRGVCHDCKHRIVALGEAAYINPYIEYECESVSGMYWSMNGVLYGGDGWTNSPDFQVRQMGCDLFERKDDDAEDK